ncbi:unnamed protein product, partial [marine sediment metagenome]
VQYMFISGVIITNSSSLRFNPSFHSEIGSNEEFLIGKKTPALDKIINTKNTEEINLFL